MTSGYPSDATDNAVQANIVAAGYGSSGGGGGHSNQEIVGCQFRPMHRRTQLLDDQRHRRCSCTTATATRTNGSAIRRASS